ncbi:hypothetical protein F443_15135 [Phytophthora nicotianae P1569]|uniref:BZIP domain-containing protein n=2 Tax=Phytophthora nicotianae TaxID=4792 RepID=V9EMG1_PHYNI|nr:hypothetical protein F443_15135 [Phytophthora nicotianae P1569]ETO68027.1 hypothetical protein F444_15115 [Phytophthora nicotianae P1976]
MDFYTLRPPNYRFLSDSIIGGVVQRRRSSRDVVSEEYRAPQSYRDYYRPRQPSYPATRPYESRPVNRTSCGSERSVIPQRDAEAVLGLLSLTSGTKRQRVESPDYSSRKLHCARTEASTPQPETDTESLNSEKQEAAAAKCREEKRLDYMHDDRISHLKKQTLKLREEIDKVEYRRREISALPARHNGWDVAVEYFKLFRYGLQSRGRSTIIKHSDEQLAFLRKTMSPNVVLNTGQGHDAMLRSWKCISLWFKDVEVKVEGLDRSAAGSLEAITETSVTVTERTLRNVFPHLISRNGTNCELAEQLLGRRIVMRGLTRFEWDSASRCFTSVIAHSDLLTPMLHLLGNVEDVAQVFQRSSVTPDFQWRSMV